MAAAQAARHVTARELAGIRAQHERFCATARAAKPDAAIAIRANQRLHFAIYGAARMPTLLDLIEGLWLRIGPVLNLDLRSSAERLRTLAAHDHHAHLVAALARHDAAGARRALVGDIEAAAAYILSLDRLS